MAWLAIGILAFVLATVLGALLLALLRRPRPFDEAAFRYSAGFATAFHARSRRMAGRLIAASALALAIAALVWVVRGLEPAMFSVVLFAVGLPAGFAYIVHRRHVAWPCPQCGAPIRFAAGPRGRVQRLYYYCAGCRVFASEDIDTSGDE
jgi:hypothetical protein